VRGNISTIMHVCTFFLRVPACMFGVRTCMVCVPYLYDRMCVLRASVSILVPLCTCACVRVCVVVCGVCVGVSVCLCGCTRTYSTSELLWKYMTYT